MKKEKKNKKNKVKKNKKEHKKLKLAIMIFLIVIFIAVIVCAAIVVANFKVAMDEFDTNDLIIGESNSTILDSEGNVIATLNGEEKRKIISTQEMAEYLPKAYIAIEDERFEQHQGVDFKRTGAAILNFVTKAGSTSFGGSTITQQLVKNATSDKDKTINRKIKEWARAYKVEKVLSKDQILETYLNIIFVGSDIYGVELGSKYYFNKSAKDLTLAECAFMAGINNSPNAYKPFAEDPDGKNKEKINKRTKTVLTKMNELGYIHSKEEYDAAMAEVDNGLAFSKGENSGNIYSYHTDTLISNVIEDLSEEKGLSKALATSYLYGGGLTIYSTQVTSIQNAMQEEFEKEKYVKGSNKIEGATTQAAMTIIENSTGHVVGCVGGLGTKSESRGLNRATQLPRQPGSAFKPIAVVGPALQEGIITGASIYDDSITTFGGNYTPKDYNTPRGLITVRQALETSQNIPFVRIMQELGTEKSREYLKQLGISTLTDEDNNLAMSIGGLSLGATTLDMAAAYATIANNGVYVEPIFYTKVLDSSGNVILENTPETHKVFDENVNYVLNDLVQEPVVGAAGTAKYCAIPGMEVGAKTGTTNNDFDRWLCGYTPYYSGATWYGYDKNETVYYSGNPAGLIWSAIMKNIHTGLEGKTFNRPSGVVTASICTETGLCATETCENVVTDLFTTGNVPTVCEGHAIPEPEPEVVPEVKVTEKPKNEVKNTTNTTGKQNTTNPTNTTNTDPTNTNSTPDNNTDNNPTLPENEQKNGPQSEPKNNLKPDKNPANDPSQKPEPETEPDASSTPTV